MNDIYYKRLIEEWGLWKSPKKTAKILKEAKSYNYSFRPQLKVSVFWKDVAKSIGISRNAMSKIVTGKGFPSRETMDKLIKYFDLTV